MKRIPFSQILKNASVDITTEYARLYSLFYIAKYKNGMGEERTFRDYCALNFYNLPYRNTCITLDDFDTVYGFHFDLIDERLSEYDLDYLLTFCEYSYNLAIYNQISGTNPLDYHFFQIAQDYIQQVLKVIELLGYMANTQDGITDFVPKNQVAITVAELVDSTLSYKVIEYNHRSMKGDLDSKKAVLLSLADKLEPQRAKLKQINSSLESDLFYLLNNLNVRHNNSDQGGKNYIPLIAAMGHDEVEQWYDDIYEMCLLAFLELEQLKRKVRINQLKQTIETNKRETMV